MIIHYGIHRSPFGWCVVGVADGKVCALSFIGSKSRKEAVTELSKSWPTATLVRSDASTKHYVTETFTGSRMSKLPLLMHGTKFQKSVWGALRKIPHGKTSTYSEIAERVGAPRAARAVGSACGQNKIGMLIPCHRVLPSNGKLGGYRWGLKRKQDLLDWEASKEL